MSLTGPESAATMRRLKPATVDGKLTTKTTEDVKLPPVSTPTAASSTSTAVTQSGLQRPKRSKSKLKHRKKTPQVEAVDSKEFVTAVEVEPEIK